MLHLENNLLINPSPPFLRRNVFPSQPSRQPPHRPAPPLDRRKCQGHRFGRQNCSWLGLLIRVMSKSLVLSSKQDLISGSSTTATRIPSSWPLWEVSSASSGLLISKGGNRHQSRGFDGSKRPSSLLVRRQREGLSSSSSLLCVASTSITVTKTASHLSSGPSFNGRSTVADLLLSHGSDHSIKDLNGQDVLKIVCSSGQRETSQVILNHKGPTSTLEGIQGTTPLMRATHSGHPRVVDLLVSLVGPISTPLKTFGTPH